ncbi:MAG: VWA domain-containing protein [Planctomycetota bacterium]
MTLDAPLWLLLWPLALAAGWWVARRRRVPGERVAWLASALLALLVGIAGPTTAGRVTSRHLALVVDLSPGMLARTGVDAAALREWCATAVNDLRAGDTVSLITIEAAPRVLLDNTVVAGHDAAAGVAIPTLAPAVHNAAGSDIAAALALALDRRPPGNVVPAVIRVYTDGQHTGAASALEAVLLRAAADGVPIAVDAPGSDPIADVGFLSIRAPQRVAPNQVVRVSSLVRTTHPARVVAQLTRNGFDVPGARLAWLLGEQPLPMDDATGAVSLPAGMPCELRATVPGDTSGFITVGLSLRVLAGENRIVANDRIVAGTIVESRRVLVLARRSADGERGELSNLTRLLQHERPDLDLDVRAPADAPTRLADLLGYSAVVLDAVPRRALPDATDRALADAVEHGGLGLLMAGSRGAFGPGGWIGSEVDRVLPVDCDPNRDVGAAVALVLDSSGSMQQGARMPMTASAASGLLAHCTSHDSIALFTFADAPHVAPPGSDAQPFVAVTPDSVAIANGTLDRLVESADMLVGQTDLHRALDTALRHLESRTDDALLLLCLTDGEPTLGPTAFADGFGELVARAARKKVFVAVICTQPFADGSLLDELHRALRNAKTGSVQFTDLAQLPREFTDRLAEARGPLLAPPRPATDWPVFDAAHRVLADAPPLVGYARTRLRDDVTGASASLWMTGHEPLLATRRAGAGRTGAVMLPLDDLALLGNAWRDVVTNGPHTPGEQRVWRELWRTIDATLAGPPLAALSVDVEESEEGRARVVVRSDAMLPAAISQGLQLRVQPAGTGDDAAKPLDLVMPAVAPQRFECVLPASAAGALWVGRVVAPDGSGQPVVVAPPLHREWQLLDVNRPQLERLHTLPARRAIDWLDQRAPATSGRVSLASWFALLAIVLLVLGEVRRVRRHLVPRARTRG